MVEETFRSCAYKDSCMACGRDLVGRGTKRKIQGFANNNLVFSFYICYGPKICDNPEKREKLLKKDESITHKKLA